MTLTPPHPRSPRSQRPRDGRNQTLGTDGRLSGNVLLRDPHRDMPLEQIARMLQDQQARQVDVIAGAGAIRSVGGRLVVAGLEPQLGADGVTLADGTYDINDIALTGIADKLAIPGAYLRRTADEHPDLFDANLNGWLERDDRRFLIRALRGSNPGTSMGTGPGTDTRTGAGAAVDGLARAFLSDRYAVIDNLDVLMSVLDGIRASGQDVQIDGCSLTDRRMHVRVSTPAVQAMAPALLRDYRSPFDGRRGADLPVVFAGFVVTNSETGCGAFTIAPRITVQVCSNGMVLDVGKVRRTHLGSQHTGEDGIVHRSHETLVKVLELISARTKDAVTTYLSPDFLHAQVRQLETLSGAPVTDPHTTIKVVSQRLRFTEDQQTAILTHFIRGADTTAGGLMHAVTSVAQALPDPDDAHDLETVAVHAMKLAAALQ